MKSISAIWDVRYWDVRYWEVSLYLVFLRVAAISCPYGTFLEKAIAQTRKQTNDKMDFCKDPFRIAKYKVTLKFY